MTKGILVALIISTCAYAKPKTICGPTDDRTQSYNQKIGRLSTDGKHQGCTVTMLSESCGISAGHCAEVLEYAEFNAPLSNSDGEAQASSPSDLYMIDKETIIQEYTGLGQDWSVMNFKPNDITGKLPGAISGFYEVDFERPRKGITVRITGYGTDYDNPEKNFVQQTHTGKVVSVGSFWSPKVIEYSTDTTGGNSGSTIINEDTQKVIGIHTNGGCSETSGSNKGVMLYKHKVIQEAIKKCLAR